MNLTPTDKGAGLAGIVLSLIGWFSLFKIDHVAKMCRLERWIKADRVFDWITYSTANKFFTLLCTEIINFSVHGVLNPASVLFASGSTLVNVFMIFVGLPLRQKMKREKAVQLQVKKAVA